MALEVWRWDEKIAPRAEQQSTTTDRCFFLLNELQVVYISKTVTMRGGYTTANGFADPPDPAANPTTLDAGKRGRGLGIGGTSIAPTVEGLRITSGGVYVADWNGGYNTVALTNTILSSHTVGISVTSGNTLTVNTVLWHNTPLTISQGVTAVVAAQNQYHP